MRKFLSLLLLLPSVMFAELSDTIPHPLSDVTVIANRSEDLKMYTPQQIHTISAAQIALTNAQTTADLLASDGLITVQRSQQAGGSPIIRGFEASRVLLVIDGVPMNNLIYRSGHLQNVITVDQCNLERAEILFGPSSVIYGSGALGGVIVFKTKDPQLSEDGNVLFKGNAFMRYGSVNNETTSHVNFNIGSEKFASFTSLTYSNFGDLRSGRSKNPFLPEGDSYIHRQFNVTHTEGADLLTPNTKTYHQPGSGYTQYDLLQKFLWTPDDCFKHTFNFQLSNTSNSPRYDRLTDMKGKKPKFAEWYYGPAFRLMAAYTFESTDKMGADHTSMTLAYQNVKESRNNRKLNDLWLGSRKENVNVVTLNTDWMKQLNEANSLHLGIDGTLSYISSTASRRNIDTDEIKTLDTRYPDGGNHMHNVDVFAAHRWMITPKLSLSDGVRLGYSSLYSKFNSSEFFPFVGKEVNDVKQNNFTYSFDLGLNYNPTNDWRLALMLSTGYYVPNIDDVGKVFDSVAGSVVVPNPDVKPEQAISVDLSVARLKRGSFLWEATIFGSYLFDAITLRPYSVDGKTEIDYDGEPSRVLANVNNKRAYILGATTNLEWQMTRNFAASARATYTYGQVKAEKGVCEATPLDHVPPLYGRVGLSYTTNNRLGFFEIFSNFNGKKSLSRYNPDGEDNINYATVLGADGEGMPAWFTLNVKANYKLTSNLMLQGAVENILDTEYRVFGSGINAPGRNYVFTLRANF